MDITITVQDVVEDMLQRQLHTLAISNLVEELTEVYAWVHENITKEHRQELIQLVEWLKKQEG